MDRTETQADSPTGSKDKQLAALMAEHQALKARLKQLAKHISLTSAEQVEYAQLKKMKLRTKDRIRMVEQN